MILLLFCDNDIPRHLLAKEIARRSRTFHMPSSKFSPWGQDAEEIILSIAFHNARLGKDVVADFPMESLERCLLARKRLDPLGEQQVVFADMEPDEESLNSDMLHAPISPDGELDSSVIMLIAKAGLLAVH